MQMEKYSIRSRKNLLSQISWHIQGARIQEANGERHARVRTLGIAQRAIHLLPSLTCIQQPRARPGQGRARSYFNPFTAEEMPRFAFASWQRFQSDQIFFLILVIFTSNPNYLLKIQTLDPNSFPMILKTQNIV